ncbi:MAG TPA: hypothetical protein VNP92_16640, partial [Actinophytocola sp.]|nr:hypothetical protein [Actinophytocola sp.]
QVGLDRAPGMVPVRVAPDWVLARVGERLVVQGPGRVLGRGPGWAPVPVARVRVWWPGMALFPGQVVAGAPVVRARWPVGVG